MLVETSHHIKVQNDFRLALISASVLPDAIGEYLLSIYIYCPANMIMIEPNYLTLNAEIKCNWIICGKSPLPTRAAVLVIDHILLNELMFPLARSFTTTARNHISPTRAKFVLDCVSVCWVRTDSVSFPSMLGRAAGTQRSRLPVCCCVCSV